MEEKLCTSNAFVTSIINSLTAHIAVLDESGVIIAVNTAWEQFSKDNGLPESYNFLLGYNYLEACKSYNQTDLIDSREARNGIEAVLAGKLETFDLDYPCFLPNQQYWFHLKASRMLNSNGCVVVSHENITESKLREQRDQDHLAQLAHVTRLGLMGEMASGIAHEVNQPLTAIATYAQVSLNLIKNKTPDLIKLGEVAVKTQEQALRAGSIIHRMKNFCKSKQLQRSNTDLNTLITDCINLCADGLKQNNIMLTLELDEHLPIINIDHIQIEQVLINLIRNSIDALSDKPEKTQRQITIQSCLTTANEIQVRIKDNGPGIDEDQQQKILMPFHTTKAEGMGMGLSISRSLIEAHNGRLHFNSQPGKGTTFYFTLPIKK